MADIVNKVYKSNSVPLQKESQDAIWHNTEPAIRATSKRLKYLCAKDLKRPPNWWPKKSRVLKSVLINTVWIRPLNSTNNREKNAKLVWMETSLYFLSVVLVLTTFHWLGYVWFVYRIFACHKMCSTSKKSLQPAFDWLRKWRMKSSTRVWHPQVITTLLLTHPSYLTLDVASSFSWSCCSPSTSSEFRPTSPRLCSVASRSWLIQAVA